MASFMNGPQGLATCKKNDILENNNTNEIFPTGIFFLKYCLLDLASRVE